MFTNVNLKINNSDIYTNKKMNLNRMQTRKINRVRVI